MKYTSIELSKKLAEGGCTLESEKHYYEDCLPNKKNEDGTYELINVWQKIEIPKYDLIHDICIKYADSFFKGKIGSWHPRNTHIIEVVYQLYHNNTQEAED